MVEPHPTPVSLKAPRQRSVRLATWLSVVPGLGQLFNRQPGKAAIFFGGVAGLFFACLNIPAVTDHLLAWWRPRGGLMVTLSLIVQMLSLLIFVGLFMAGLTFWYASMHDARLTARRGESALTADGRWWLFHR